MIENSAKSMQTQKCQLQTTIHWKQTHHIPILHELYVYNSLIDKIVLRTGVVLTFAGEIFNCSSSYQP